MAQDIIKMVAKKAGISEPIAKIAVETVVSLIKDKLPDVIGNQIDAFLGTSTGTTKASTGKAKTTAKSTKNDSPLGGLTDIIGGIGGLLGKK